jgi:hypothetical protein
VNFTSVGKRLTVLGIVGFFVPLRRKVFAARGNFLVAIPTAWTVPRTPLLTTKITKDTKVSEILFLNFVLFVSFVV